MNEELRRESEQLRREKTKALQARYLEVFGEESKSSNQAHLFAWHLHTALPSDLASPHGGNGSSTPGAQIECVRGCRMAQTVQAPVPSKNRPMRTQARMFNLLRMTWPQSASLPHPIHGACWLRCQAASSRS
jgi:hypothetical protein